MGLTGPRVGGSINHKFGDRTRARLAAKASPRDLSLEYGVDYRTDDHDRLGMWVSLSTLTGVHLRIKYAGNVHKTLATRVH